MRKKITIEVSRDNDGAIAIQLEGYDDKDYALVDIGACLYELTEHNKNDCFALISSIDDFYRANEVRDYERQGNEQTIQKDNNNVA